MASIFGQDIVFTDTVPMKTITDVASATVTYRGYAPIGTSTSATAWRISRSTVSGSATTLEWAGTSADFIANWSFRTAINYG
jgi:hypothetical protein